MLEVFLERSLAFALFWGIWLLAPLAVDITTALVYMFVVIFFPGQREGKEAGDLSFVPMVSLVIPVHDSAATLGHCLHSLVQQNYPLDKLQIICVNNNSRDHSFEVYSDFQNRHRQLNMNWISLDRTGKSIALNAGIYMMVGDYIINVDADAWLEEDAIRRMVLAFENDPSLVAATGGFASIRGWAPVPGSSILCIIAKRSSIWWRLTWAAAIRP